MVFGSLVWMWFVGSGVRLKDLWNLKNVTAVLLQEPKNRLSTSTVFTLYLCTSILTKALKEHTNIMIILF